MSFHQNNLKIVKKLIKNKKIYFLKNSLKYKNKQTDFLYFQ
jgi:hypothetical protein